MGKGNRLSADERPCCVQCQGLMIQTGAPARHSWGCKRCNAYTRQRTLGEFSRGMKRKREDVPVRFCKKCGHQMWVGSIGRGGARNYRCGHCAKLRTPQAKAADRRARERQNPHCLRCRRMMHKARGRLGRLIFECVTCNFTVSHRPTPQPYRPSGASAAEGRCAGGRCLPVGSAARIASHPSLLTRAATDGVGAKLPLPRTGCADYSKLLTASSHRTRWRTFAKKPAKQSSLTC